MDEIVLDFGSRLRGTFAWSNNKQWLKLSNRSPASMAKGDLDGNGREELIVQFDDGRGAGIYWNNARWSDLHPFETSHISTADRDGDGHREVIVGFAEQMQGTYSWSTDHGWERLHELSSVKATGADLDGDGREEVVADFGTDHGIGMYMNNNAWLDLHALSPKKLAAGNTDGI